MKLYGDKIVYPYKKINSELKRFYFYERICFTQNNIKLDQVIKTFNEKNYHLFYLILECSTIIFGQIENRSEIKTQVFSKTNGFFMRHLSLFSKAEYIILISLQIYRKTLLLVVLCFLKQIHGIPQRIYT